MITVVLLDLDGVVRHFDPSHVASIESRFGLASGSLLEAAFRPDLLTPAITGQLPRHDWVTKVGQAVDCPEAATEWMAERGTVDWEVVRVADELRASGTTVAILSNGTDTVADEMQALELTHHFDAIFSTYDIGFAKPDRRAFIHVCESLDVEPTRVFFTDDSPGKLAGAIELGMTAEPFTGVSTLRGQLNQLGLGD